MSLEETNTALIGRSRAGDADAFGSLVRQYAGRAIGTATLMLGSHHDALDASQEAFVRAWRRIDRFRGDGSFYAWFSAILQNVCIDRIRRRAKRKHASLDGAYDLADTDDCPQCRQELAELKELKEGLAMMKFKEPGDAELERYWHGIYNRLERGIGWILLSIGAIALLCYGAFKLVEEMITDPTVQWIVKIGVLALLAGVVVLFVSLLRERLMLRRTDKYSKEVQR